MSISCPKKRFFITYGQKISRMSEKWAILGGLSGYIIRRCNANNGYGGQMYKPWPAFRQYTGSVTAISQPTHDKYPFYCTKSATGCVVATETKKGPFFVRRSRFVQELVSLRSKKFAHWDGKWAFVGQRACHPTNSKT